MSTRTLPVASVLGLVLLLTYLPGVGAVAAAPSTKSVTIEVTFVAQADGCHPVATATWTGYRSDHARFIFVSAGADPLTEWQFFGTFRTADGRSTSNGTITVVDPVSVPTGTWWQVDVLVRSPGGAHLWEGTSAPALAPASCRM